MGGLELGAAMGGLKWGAEMGGWHRVPDCEVEDAACCGASCCRDGVLKIRSFAVSVACRLQNHAHGS